MYYYLDKELVQVTADNVWDIEEIPSFSYVIENLGIKVEASETNRKSTKLVNETYTFSDPTVKGASNKNSAYALYKLDLDQYNSKAANGKQITTSILTDVTYEKIAEKLKGKLAYAPDKDYFDLYTTAISEIIAEKVNGKAEDVKKIFGEAIGEYNDKITENDPEWSWNKYQWTSKSKRFQTVEEGTFMVVADYWEKDLPMQRAAAYKIVVVSSTSDVIKGETQWLKDNVVSVALFAVAAVMLVIIIILLLIKPSDETLEDVDKSSAKKSNKKDKKSK